MLGYSLSEVASKFVKFAIIGAIGSGINLAVLYALTSGVHIWYLYSECVAILIAASFNFWGNVRVRNINLSRRERE